MLESLLIYTPVLLLGLAMGSFVNAWVWRTRVGTSILRGWSACPRCHHRLACIDNIPVLSYVWQKAKCRYCRRSISCQYPVVESTVGALFVGSAWLHEIAMRGLTVDIVLSWLVLVLLTFIFIYDLRYTEIWDRVTTIPAVILGALLGAFGFMAWTDMLLGVLIGGGFFLVQYVVSKGRWIGGGDVRMGVFMGVTLGWKLLLVALFISYVLGAIVGVGLLAAKKKTRKSELPFGSFLAVGTGVALFWGEAMLSWYLSVLS